MAGVTICSEFGAQKNKVCYCFHCFPIYLAWSDGTGTLLLFQWSSGCWQFDLWFLCLFFLSFLFFFLRFGSSFYMFFPPPGPALCKLGLSRSAVCSIWSLHSGPRTFLVFLATAILDSFSLFYLPSIPPSRDGRPNSLGIGASRSFWLLPAELGQWGVLGLPFLLVSSLRLLIAVSI